MKSMENPTLIISEKVDLPRVYYTNPWHKVDRKLYMETQFKHFGIEFTRINMPGPETYYDNYEHRITGTYSSKSSHWINFVSSLIVEFLSEWYTTTNEPYLLLMEDDYDLSLIPKWKFGWNEFLYHLPYDWDCIQLGFECPNVIPFYLHPIKSDYSLGATLMNREFVSKLLDLHYPNNKFKFDYSLANYEFINRESGIHDGKTYDDTSGGPDHFLNHTCRCYSIPMIPINPYLSGMSHDGITAEGIYKNTTWKPKLSFVKCYEAYHEWWNNDRDDYTLEDIFTYNKKNDNLMQRDISRWDDKYFYEKAMRCREDFLLSWN